MEHKVPFNKVPGTMFIKQTPDKPKNENIKDLTTLNKCELEELLDRQVKLLSRSNYINRLPDKGKRIQEFHDRIVKEIEKHKEVDKAAELFSQLNIVKTGIERMTSIEWNGKYNANINKEETYLDSDADEDDINGKNPLKIIAQSKFDKKKIKTIKPEPKLITEKDLKEIENFKNDKTEVELKDKLSKIENSNEVFDPHVNYVCSKEILEEKKPKFKPFYTTKSNVHNPEREKLYKKPKNWEVTAATPPLLAHNKAQLLSLHESIEIQLEQKKNLKEIQEKQAIERLILRDKILKERLKETESNSSPMLSQLYLKYRTKLVDDVDEEDVEDEEDDLANEINSDNEVHDDCGEDKGGVVYICN